MHLVVKGNSGTLVHRTGGSDTFDLAISQPSSVLWESDIPTPSKGRIGPAQFVSLWQNGALESPAPVNATVKLNNSARTGPIDVHLTALTFSKRTDVMTFTAQSTAPSNARALPEGTRLSPVVLDINADMVPCPIRFSPQPAGKVAAQLKPLVDQVTDQQEQVNAATARARADYRTWVTESGQSGTNYEQWLADDYVNGSGEASLRPAQKRLQESLTQLNAYLNQQDIAVTRYTRNGTWETLSDPGGKPFVAVKQTGCLK